MKKKRKYHIPDYQIHFPPLGEGTFGTVFHATYRGLSDRAVKVFKPDAVDLSAMHRELEKLSRVAEHRGIVTLHDFNLLANPPYYAMSLHADRGEDGTWKARTLSGLCGKVDAREGIRLIDEISDALAYLHLHQVLHCDIKPSNVMLTNETPARIKICDFGQSRGTLHERHADAGGTPLYASPEQLLHPDESGDGKGYHWDVYSFGVLAYQLITGRLPRLQHLIDDDSADDLHATLPDEQTMQGPDSPQTSLHARHLAELLEQEPDVEWPSHAPIDGRRKAILARCLSLDPAERPADMREVHNEIQRCVHERSAVRARNWSLLFGSITLLAVSAFSWGLVETNRARQAIVAQETARRQAEDLVNLMMSDLREKLRPLGQAELLEYIAENADTYFSSLSRDLQSVETLRYFANVLESRGAASLSLGDHEKAIDALQKAFNIQDQLMANGHGTPETNYQTAETLVRLAEAHRAGGNLEEARNQLEAARALRDPDAPAGADLETYLQSTARIHTRLGQVHAEKDDPDAAVEEWQAALALYQQIDANPDFETSPGSLAGMLGTLNALGEIHAAQGDLKEAAAWYERSIDEGRGHLKQFRNSAQIQRSVAAGLHALGDLEFEQGRQLEAMVQFRQELILRSSLYRKALNAPEPGYRLALAHAAVARCYDLKLVANRGLALANYREAIRVLEAMPNPQSLREERDQHLTEYRLRISAIYEMEE